MKKDDFPEPLDDAALARTWTDAWAGLGRPVPLALRLELQRSWAEEHRRYHDLCHLRECMALWVRWRGHCDRPAEVAIALWFHDAIHDPKESGNELKSASWAARALVARGVAADAAQRVFDLIMATRHDAPPEGRDAEFEVDIDLAIFGSPSARFERYDKDIRTEYAWIPGFRYRLQRTHVLKGFVDRTHIYCSPPFREMFEQPARRNLAAAMSRLEQ